MIIVTRVTDTKGDKSMRKMDRVFREKGIIFEPNEYMMGMGPEYDESAQVVDITDKFIITVCYSAVLDPILYIWDRYTLQKVAYQNLYPETMFFGVRFDKWMSWVE